MLTLEQSMELAGTNLLNSLSPKDDYLPLWSVTIDADMRARRRMYWPEHNIGRWWDALLRLEAATGFAIPAHMEAAMLRHLRGCLDNPLSICASMDTTASCFDAHSQREILLALAALVRWRDNDWAATAGHEMVVALDRFIQDDGAWDSTLMNDTAAKGGRHVDVPPTDPKADRPKPGIELTGSHGRMIEALLELYTATGDTAAMLLASRLAEFHLQASTRPDGTVPEYGGYVHTHSLFGTYRGLLMYGQLTRQRQYIDRVAATYARTVRVKVHHSGFISHDWGSEQKGETTSPGDAAQLALWLAQLGYTEFLDDAERIVRARILPSQITSAMGLQPADDDDGPPEDLDALTVGAFGGMHTHPHGGILPTTDITAADLHTLCDIYTHVVEETEAGLVVNFHLDYEDERVRIETTRGDSGRLAVQPKIARPVLIRIPAWVPPESVELAVDGQHGEPSWIGHSLIVSAPEPPGRIEVGYDLPVQTMVERIDGDDYDLTWRGDDVFGVSPNTDFLPFYSTPG